MATKSRNNGKTAESTAPKRVALYARVSTTEQATEGVSIENQIEKLGRWANLMGYTIAGEYVDPGHSGKDDKRPAFAQLILDAKRGKFDVIVVAMLDRLMRNLRLLLNHLHDLENLGITFVSVNESLDTSTPNGKFSIQIMGVIAEFERERISERNREAKSYRKRHGLWPGGVVRYGYRWNKETSKLEIIEEEASVIRLIYDLYLNRNMGIGRITQQLNREGYRTRPSRCGKNDECTPGVWHPTSIHRCLTDPKYTGEDEHYDFPRIVPKEMFEAAGKKLVTSRSIRREFGVWLLQGRVVCGKCGHVVSPRKRSARHNRKYECIGRHKNLHYDGSPRCDLPPIPADELENVTWRVLAQTLTQENLMRQSIEDAVREMESRQKALGYDVAIDQKLTELAGQKERLCYAYTEGGMSKDWFREKMQEIDVKTQKMERRRDNLNPDSRLEVAKLEDYIKTVRDILADGSIKMNHSGLLLGTVWHGDKNTDLIPEDHDLFDLFDGQEPDLDDDPIYVTTEPAIEPDGKTHESLTLHLSKKESADFERRDEIIMERKRNLLEKFDVKVVAHPDGHYEMRAMAFTRRFKTKWASISQSSPILA